MDGTDTKQSTLPDYVGVLGRGIDRHWQSRSGITSQKLWPRVGRRLAQRITKLVSWILTLVVRYVKLRKKRAKSGSYLLSDPDQDGTDHRNCGPEACAPTPVTAKIRLGCTRDQMNFIDIAQVVEGAGAAALTVHGRTAQDMFRGEADWDRISEIKPYLKHIPLIGNGDLDHPDKVLAAFQKYDVDGVMIARASLGRPWLFAQCAAALEGREIPEEPSLSRQKQIMIRHYELICERFGETRGTLLMRKYACCYAVGKPGARHFRTHAAKMETAAEFYQVIEEYFPRAEATSEQS